jgi:hypothetical protein
MRGRSVGIAAHAERSQLNAASGPHPDYSLALMAGAGFDLSQRDDIVPDL